MADLDGDRYCFIAEWFDALAAITRQYYLNYYVNSKSTEMIDVKQRKLFLKKSKVGTVTMENLYIGSMIHIYSRPLTITDFGDEFTRKKLASKIEKTIAVMKPDALRRMGEIISLIIEKGFLITKMKMMKISRGDAAEFYSEHLGKIFYDSLLLYLSSGPIMVMELMATDAVVNWRNVIGPMDPAEARKSSPASLRAKFGTDKTVNALHGSDSLAAVARDCEFFFPSSGTSRQNTAMCSASSTCCIIKPHAHSAGLTGSIMGMIQNRGFNINMVKMYYLEKANAEEFLEVYKGVLHEYPSMVDELRMGPCVVMEITGGSDDTPRAFREMVGPMDPEIARHLRPQTLRALFGKDKVHNAVHCTDLPEDGLLEVEYFFKILDR